MEKTIFYKELSDYIDTISTHHVDDGRKEILKELIEYIQTKLDNGEAINLSFICTHNSRRSQFGQGWAQTMASYFGIPVKCFSGGTEVTAFNIRAVRALQRAGFKITGNEDENPVYTVTFSDDHEGIKAFSKLYNDPVNESQNFAAVMTCDHAEASCPFIPGTEKRISLVYEDPGKYDGTPQESVKYDERSAQIAGEMHHVFSSIKRYQ